MLTLAGVNDENLIELARQTGAKIALRGETLAVSGNAESVARAIPIAQRMIDTAKQQMPMTADDVLRMSIEAPREGNGTGVDNESRIVLPGVRKIIQAKTSGQAEYMKLMAENDIVVGIGPAGTGKTYLAVAAAVDALARKRVRRIVLARPAVEAGESLVHACVVLPSWIVGGCCISATICSARVIRCEASSCGPRSADGNSMPSI